MNCYRSGKRESWRLAAQLSFIMLCLSFIVSNSAYALSLEQEEKMGQQFAFQVSRQLDLVDDDFAHRYINSLGQYLIRPLETKPFPFRFNNVKHKALNAFAGPGGHIYVFSGLVEAVDSLDELVAVLCHEIGHVGARHIASRFEQNKKIGMASMVGVLAGVIAGVAGGSGAGIGVAVGSLAAGQQAQLNYSRVAERQADQISFKLMEPTGFNPEGMIGALTKISKSSWVGSGNVPTYLLSHPAGTERMANFESMLTNYTQPPKGKEAAMFTAYFPYFQTIMRARCHDPQQAEAVFLREMEEDPTSFLPHFGLALIYKQNDDFDKAESHFYRAIEKQKDFPPLLTSLGKLHQLQGEYEAAVPCYKKALKIEAKNRETLFHLGETYRHLDEYEKSAAIFERLINLKPVKTEVFQQLGIVYGRQDKLALAHYNFGIYFKRLRDAKKARFHFEKAQKLAGSDTVLREKIFKEKEGIPKVR